jgi:hypothetical protein
MHPPGILILALRLCISEYRLQTYPHKATRSFEICREDRPLNFLSIAPDTSYPHFRAVHAIKDASRSGDPKWHRPTTN